MPKPITFYRSQLEKKLKSRGDDPDLPILSLPDLNKKIWGIHKGKLTVIGGRTSNGKSAFAMQIAYDLACQDKGVLYLSLEMDTLNLLERVFCLHSNVDNMDLLHGRFDQVKYDQFMEEAKKIKLVVDDSIGKTWHEIEKHIAGMSVKPDVIIIDYIQTIKKSGMQERAVIDEYLRNLREMAIRDNFAAIIVSQINRSSQEEGDKKPQLHNLKGTGFLEEHADVVMLVHWDSRSGTSKDPNKFTLFVAKNKDGRTGYVGLKFYPQYYLFKDEATDERKGQVQVNWQD